MSLHATEVVQQLHGLRDLRLPRFASHLGLLAHLEHLEVLWIGGNDGPESDETAPYHNLATGVQNMRSLRELRLRYVTFTEADLWAIATLRGTMRVLDIDNVRMDEDELRELLPAIARGIGALTQLEEFAADQLPWELASGLVARMNQLRKLRITGCQNLDFLHNLPELEELHITLVNTVVDETLELADISGLNHETLPKLNSLQVVVWSAEDPNYQQKIMQQISTLDKLQSLDLIFSTPYESLEFVAGLTNLRALHFIRSAVADGVSLAPVTQHLVRLESLIISGYRDFTELTEGNLMSLKRLVIDGHALLRPLANMPNLETLKFYQASDLPEEERCTLGDSRILEGSFPSLRALYLGNFVCARDLSDLVSPEILGNLRELYLTETQITELPGNLSRLRKLTLEHTTVDAVPAEGLPNLRFLSIRQNPVEDLSVANRPSFILDD